MLLGFHLELSIMTDADIIVDLGSLSELGVDFAGSGWHVLRRWLYRDVDAVPDIREHCSRDAVVANVDIAVGRLLRLSRIRLICRIKCW